MGNCPTISNNKVAVSRASCSTSSSSTKSVKTSKIVTKIKTKSDTKIEQIINQLKKVCDYLSFEDVLKCRLVCKDWEGFIRLEYTRFAEANVKFSPAIFLMKKADINSAFMLDRIVPWRNVDMKFFPFQSKSSLLPYWKSCGKFVKVLHLRSLSVECIELVRFLDACPALQEVTFRNIGFKPQFSERCEEAEEEMPYSSKSKKLKKASGSEISSFKISSISKILPKSKKSSASKIMSATEKAGPKHNLASSWNSTLSSDAIKKIKKSLNTRASSGSTVTITAKGCKKSKTKSSTSSNDSSVISNLSAKVKKIMEKDKAKRTSSSSSSSTSSDDEETIKSRAKWKRNVKSPDCKWDSTTITFCPHKDMPADVCSGSSIYKSRLISITFKNQIIMPLCLLDYLSDRSIGSLQKFVYQDNIHLSSSRRDYMKKFVIPNAKSVEHELDMFMMLKGRSLKSLTIAHTESFVPFENKLHTLEELCLKSKNYYLYYDYLGFGYDEEIKLLKRYEAYNIRILNIAFYNPEKLKLEAILADYGKKNILEKLKMVLIMGRIDLRPMLQNLTQVKDLEILELPYYDEGEQKFGTERGVDPLFLSELPKSLMSFSIQLSFRGDVMKDLIFEKSKNSFENLKQLKIKYCDLDDEMFKEIVKHCSFLEVLHVCDSKMLSDPGITGLPKKTCIRLRKKMRLFPTLEAKVFTEWLAQQELTTETEVDEEVTTETEVEEEATTETEVDEEVTTETEVEDEATTETKIEEELTTETKFEEEVTTETKLVNEVTTETKIEEELTTETKFEEEVTTETKLVNEVTTETKLDEVVTPETKELTPETKEIISINNLKNLKILNLSGCVYVSEVSLACGIESDSLKALILTDCIQVKGGGIKFALDKNPNIQRLVINNVNITHKQIIGLVLYSKNVQKIHLEEKKRKECLDCAKGAHRVLLSDILTSKPPSPSDISQEYVEPWKVKTYPYYVQ